MRNKRKERKANDEKDSLYVHARACVNDSKRKGEAGCDLSQERRGGQSGTSFFGAGERGFYWSATPYEGYTDDTLYLYFYGGFYGIAFYKSCYPRYHGQSVRPVSK